MSTTNADRDAVIARYSGLARTAASGDAPVDTPDGAEISGCGATAYTNTQGVPDGAVRASLACGNPVAVAELHPGDTVLDLGSGGGLDVILSARRVGPTGHVYGLDASPDMLNLARTHAQEAGASNTEFLHGYLEDIPLPAHTVDVVISNCVLNLSTDKPRALTETARVLRPGGRLGISDIIAEDNLNPAQRATEEAAANCASGTLTATEYHHHLTTIGYTDITITLAGKISSGLNSAIIQARTPA